MKYLSFDDLQARLQELYAAADYAAALQLANEAFETFPEEAHLINFWRISMASRLGDEAQALKILEQVVSAGFWYGETLLRRSPALRPLQNHPEFEQLVQANLQLQEQDKERLYPLITLRQEGHCRFDGPPCPLLFALHPNGATAQSAVPYWQAAASAGWLVAAPQSFQAIWKGAYVWDDRPAAESELQKLFHSAQEKYNLDPQQIVLAGVGEGATLAAWMALSGQIPGETPARGFVLFAPTGPLLQDRDAWRPLLSAVTALEQRAYIILGAEDETTPAGPIEDFAELLNTAGIECELEVTPQAGAGFTPTYADSLLRGIAYVLQ